MTARRAPSGGRSGLDGPPIANTHLHVPPNFSAFETVEDAAATAGREHVAVAGTSNFHDLRVYERFRAAAERAGVVPLYGFEFISVLDDAEREGHRVNDPENPGRAYLCGKGIPEPWDPGPAARERLGVARSLNEARMERMAARLRDVFADSGLETDLDHEAVAADVAAHAQVPRDWVVLQERHVAEAFQGTLFGSLDADGRRAVLARAYGESPRAALDDPIAVQGEIRSRLMKAGGPAFEPESPIPFDAAYALVLDLHAIPCYPTLADGAHPTCEWETPPAALVERILERGIHTAELIPIRNRPEVVEEYVAAWRPAGIVVMAGTEHNTKARIPVEPRCLDGLPLPPAAREAFWEGTCVVAAHQHLRSTGRAGYVDDEGRLNTGFPDGETRIRWFRELGEELIRERGRAA